MYFITNGIFSSYFIIIYLGAICVLILFQAKLVRLLTEKNQQIFLNNIIFIPCLFIFLIIPLIQMLTIYHLLFNSSLDIFISNNEINQFFFYNNWINDLNFNDTLKIVGFIYIIIIIFI